MKVLLSIIFLNLTISFAGQHQVLNPFINNESQKLSHVLFARLPITEEVRVACHLLYAEQLLRSKNTKHLSRAQQLNREKMCDLLHFYTLRG
jgi:hypothetical protein